MSRTTQQADSLSVLIVDHEPAILIVLSAMLEAHGIRALRARSVAEAVEIAERPYVQLDLVLCNLVLPEASGPEITRQLLEIRPGAPFVYMSGFCEDEVIRVELVQPAGISVSREGGGQDLAAAIRSVVAAHSLQKPMTFTAARRSGTTH
jgi:CheY-like chemotaxis protein